MEKNLKRSTFQIAIAGVFLLWYYGLPAHLSALQPGDEIPWSARIASQRVVTDDVGRTARAMEWATGQGLMRVTLDEAGRVGRIETLRFHGWWETLLYVLWLAACLSALVPVARFVTYLARSRRQATEHDAKAS